MKRWLYITHRWIGVGACVLMALWFLSGVVMLYVGYPKLTPAERLAHLPALALSEGAASPAEALRALGLKRAPEELRLAMVAGEAAYVVREGRDRWHVVPVAGARPAGDADVLRASRSAQAYLPGVPVTFLDQVREDAWTHSKALDAHRPLYRFAFDDAEGTQVYVSSRTGEVVRDSTRLERNWNWVGAWLHWLYMFRGNWFDPAWHDIVVWSSLIATAGSVVGLWIGVLRWRFRAAYKGSASHSPYREPWMWWHHVLGLVFSLATIFWIFSGLMSMNPWKVFATPGAKPADVAAFRGGTLDASRFALPPAAALGQLKAGLGDVKELEFTWFDGKPWIIGREAGGGMRLVEAREGATPVVSFDTDAVAVAAARLLPGERVARTSMLAEYDNWYLQRATHTMLGHVERPLPVLRIEFADPHATMFHVDPRTGAVLGRVDDLGRWKRWLFAALHSWDLKGLVDRRPLWDILMIGFSIGGFALCVTSIVIGWRRTKRKLGFAPARGAVHAR